MTTSLITGANRGLGLEVARQLGAIGHTILLGVRGSESGIDTETRLRGEGMDAHFVQIDMSDPQSIETAADEVSSRFGGLNVLINNAAIHYDTHQRVGNPDFDIVEQAHNTNVLSPWRLALACHDMLKKARSPRLVNVSSASGALAQMIGETPAYCLSKLALNGLTMMLANEWEQDGILVNAICPGWCFTDMGQGGRPPSEGAKSIVWAALLKDDGPTGGFFRDGRRLDW